MSPEGIRQSLLNWRLADFGTCSDKQWSQNQIHNIFGGFLCLLVLFDFYFKLFFELDKVS